MASVPDTRPAPGALPDDARPCARKILRVVLAGVFAGFLAGVLAGTWGCAEPASDPGTITILYDADERLMSPLVDEEPKFLVFLPLASSRRDGGSVGRLARSWEHSDDYQTWTVHLRTDVRWHDGVPVTAHDVVFTIQLLGHRAILYYPPGSVSAEASDDSTVVIRYSTRPGLQVTTDLWWTVFYPRHLLRDLDPADLERWDFWKQPVGNGPYRYARHVPQTMMELEANPDYYAGQPPIDRVILRFGPPNLLELQAGNVDVVPYADPTAAAALGADPRFRIYHTINALLGRAIFWNQQDPRLADVRVRRALTMAIDRREIIRALDLPDYVPVVDGPYTDRQLWRRDFPKPLPYDPAGAERLLTEAGWSDEDGDGVREREGAELRFPMIVAAERSWEQIAVLVQAFLREVGVALEIETLDPRAAEARVARGGVSASLWRYVGTPRMLRFHFGEGSVIAYRNPRVAALIDELSHNGQPQRQDSLYRELIAVFQEDLPATYLMPRVLTVAAHRRVHGLESPFRVFPSRHMEELWIEDGP